MHHSMRAGGGCQMRKTFTHSHLESCWRSEELLLQEISQLANQRLILFQLSYLHCHHVVASTGSSWPAEHAPVPSALDVDSSTQIHL